MDIRSLRARRVRTAASLSLAETPARSHFPARRVAPGWAAALASLVLWLAGPTGALASTVGAPTQQQRDGERVDILRTELARAVRQIEDLDRRSGQPRLPGTDEAALAIERHRAMADKAALEREIARAQSVAVAPPSTSARSTGQPPPRAASQDLTRDATPWWDVYGKPPRVMTAAPSVPVNP